MSRLVLSGRPHGPPWRHRAARRLRRQLRKPGPRRVVLYDTVDLALMQVLPTVPVVTAYSSAGRCLTTGVPIGTLMVRTDRYGCRRTRMATSGRTAAGERAWESACGLFYREGLRASGVAEIARRAGDRQAEHLPQLRFQGSTGRGLPQAQACAPVELLVGLQAAYPNDPAAQLHSVIAEIADALRSPGHRGCPLANAAVEFPDRDHPIRRAADQLKSTLPRRVHRIDHRFGGAAPRSTGLSDPDAGRRCTHHQPDVRCRPFGTRIDGRDRTRSSPISTGPARSGDDAGGTPIV